MSEPITDEHARVAAAVIVEDGQVLLVRRRVKEGDMLWQFPAGKVEPGESACEAAVRETREETGVTVRAVTSLGERVHPHTGRTMAYVICDVLDGVAYVAAGDEVAAVAWCGRTELACKVPYPLFDPVQGYLDVTLRRPR